MGYMWKWDNITFHNKKLSQSHHIPRCPEGSRQLRFPDYVTMTQDGVKVVNFMPRSLFTPEYIPGTHFCWRLSQPQDHRATGRFMSMKNSNYTIGDRTRKLPACSAVPHPPASPRTAFIGSPVSEFNACHVIGSDVKRPKTLLHILSVYRMHSFTS